jgi:L-ascorbate metabolism protein UlaG (beta-lactamase superfamily)
MRLTKWTHACVVLEGSSGILVIDPGIWSEPQALIGADAILITHQHSDHVDRLRIAGLGVPVYAPVGAEIPDLSFTGINVGDSLDIAGFRVAAVGGKHATIYDSQPDCANLGYVIDDALYHPGDSLFQPGRPIDTLLVPAHASWLKTAEAIDFMREIGPTRAFAIHDGQINERGLAGVNQWFATAGGTDYRWLAAGDATDI